MTIKLYTFLGKDGEILGQVKAEDHNEAVTKSGGREKEGQEVITNETDFYSEDYE